MAKEYDLVQQMQLMSELQKLVHAHEESMQTLPLRHLARVPLDNELAPWFFLALHLNDKGYLSLAVCVDDMGDPRAVRFLDDYFECHKRVYVAIAKRAPQLHRLACGELTIEKIRALQEESDRRTKEKLTRPKLGDIRDAIDALRQKGDEP